jgi:hypothetical protein
MANETRPFQFLNHLPSVFRAGELTEFTVRSASGTTITVAPFDTGVAGIPSGTPVSALSGGSVTTLSAPVPANSTGLTRIEVRDASFASALGAGDVLSVSGFFSRFLKTFEVLFEELQSEIEGVPGGVPPALSGGIPDLFSPDTTPPAQFKHRPQPDFDYLNFLASWIALPLRPDKPVDWNRRFFSSAIQLYSRRSTLEGMEELLRAWLKDDLLETTPPLLFLTDLTRTRNDIDAVFQLAPEGVQEKTYAQLGLNTVLGEGPPFFFIADLITDPGVKKLRHPVGLDNFVRAARFLLDAEKPAHTYYQLRVRAHPMQLAPPPGGEVAGEVYAQVGKTTLLWDKPLVFDSD